MTALQRYDDLEAVSLAGADELVRIARASEGAIHIALSGGSTPKRMYELLAAMGRDALPWDRVEVWFGDERTVPPDHPDSNYGMAKRTLLDPLGLTRVHRMRGEDDPEAAALAYERELVAACGQPPVLDLVLLGMGGDGHTASLFPGSPGLAETRRSVIANPVDSPLAKGKTTRLTMTVPAIAAARHVRFLVAGPDKAHVLPRALAHASPDVPSSLIRGRDVVWLVDGAAAAELTP